MVLRPAGCRRSGRRDSAPRCRPYPAVLVLLICKVPVSGQEPW